MAEEPGEVSRLLSIHYDQPEEQRKQCSAMNNLTERYGNKLKSQRNSTRQQYFLPRWILLQAAFTRSFSQYYRPDENRRTEDEET